MPFLYGHNYFYLTTGKSKQISRFFDGIGHINASHLTKAAFSQSDLVVDIAKLRKIDADILKVRCVDMANPCRRRGQTGRRQPSYPGKDPVMLSEPQKACYNSRFVVDIAKLRKIDADILKVRCVDMANPIEKSGYLFQLRDVDDEVRLGEGSLRILEKIQSCCPNLRRLVTTIEGEMR
jgi:hypothetical protein